MAKRDVYEEWASRSGQGWDPERAQHPGHDGQVSDYNQFFDLLDDKPEDLRNSAQFAEVYPEE